MYWAIASAAVIVIGLAAFLLSYQRRILSLNWPTHIEYHQLTRFFDRYMRHHGWNVMTPDIAIHLKIAKKPGQTVRICLLPSHVDYNPSRLKDLAEIAKAPAAGGRPLVCVTANEVPAHFLPMAAVGGVIFLHYRKLTLFADPALNAEKYFIDLRKALSKEAAAVSPPR